MAEPQQQQEAPMHGRFCWMELHSKNVEACKTFYSAIFGWELHRNTAIEGMEYTEFGMPAQQRAGGMFQMTEEFGEMPAHWMAYIAVDDVDQAVSKVWELGGNVCVPPTDIPNVGRFSVINDPGGATLSLITLKQ